MYDGAEPRIYIPVQSEIGEILRIDTSSINLVPNGNNLDALWLEHANDFP
jgi:hypothetical protein